MKCGNLENILSEESKILNFTLNFKILNFKIYKKLF
jgi:hypothetical protein